MNGSNIFRLPGLSRALLAAVATGAVFTVASVYENLNLTVGSTLQGVGEVTQINGAALNCVWVAVLFFGLAAGAGLVDRRLARS